MNDRLEWWRRKQAGENPPMHINDPECGYFKGRECRCGQRGLCLEAA